MLDAEEVEEEVVEEVDDTDEDEGQVAETGGEQQELLNA